MRRGRTTGFTLIELLLGVMISTLILGAASAVFVMILRGWERARRGDRTASAARAAGDLLERHLRAAVGPAGEPRFVFRGEPLGDEDRAQGHRLTFLTSAPLRLPFALPPAETHRVDFICDPLKGGELVMRVTDASGNTTDRKSGTGDSRGGRAGRGNNPAGQNQPTPPPTPQPTPQAGDGADNLSNDSDESAGDAIPLSGAVRSFRVLYFDGQKWIEEWNAATLPRAVEFHLTFADEDEAPAPVKREDGEAPTPTPPPSPTPAAQSAAPRANESGEKDDGRGGDEAPLEGYTISRLVTIPLATETEY